MNESPEMFGFVKAASNPNRLRSMGLLARESNGSRYGRVEKSAS